MLRSLRERRRADRHRDALRQIKIEKGCTDCGYRENHAALEFDHLDGNQKINNVSSMIYLSWVRILSELEKCEVVCANCHAIRTQERKTNASVAKW